MGEEETVLDSESRVVRGLANVHPALLPGGGNEIKASESDAESGSGGSAQDRRPGAAKNRENQRNGGEQVAGHHAERGVREPRAGDDQGQRRGRPIECAPNQRAVWDSIAKDEKKKQGNPESGKFAEGGALVGREERVTGEKSRASGQG